MKYRITYTERRTVEVEADTPQEAIAQVTEVSGREVVRLERDKSHEDSSQDVVPPVQSSG